MDERVTLRSHLDRSASLSPLGASIGEVIEAIATAAIELAILIGDGPLAGITGRDGAINPDGKNDIDVAADEMMRRALRSAPVAALLSEEAALPGILHPDAPLCIAIDPLDGSADLQNNISVGTIFSIRPRGNDLLSTFFEPGTAPAPQASPSMARRRSWFSPSTAVSTSSFSTGVRATSCCLRTA